MMVRLHHLLALLKLIVGILCLASYIGFVKLGSVVSYLVRLFKLERPSKAYCLYAVGFCLSSVALIIAS